MIENRSSESLKFGMAIVVAVGFTDYSLEALLLTFLALGFLKGLGD